MTKLEHQIKALKKNKSADSLILNLEQQDHHWRRKYLKSYNELLDAERFPSVNFSKPENTAIIINTLQF